MMMKWWWNYDEMMMKWWWNDDMMWNFWTTLWVDSTTTYIIHCVQSCIIDKVPFLSGSFQSSLLHGPIKNSKKTWSFCKLWKKINGVNVTNMSDVTENWIFAQIFWHKNKHFHNLHRLHVFLEFHAIYLSRRSRLLLLCIKAPLLLLPKDSKTLVSVFIKSFCKK